MSARVAKYSYGVTVDEEFDPADPEHVRRESTKFTSMNGKFCIPGGFSTMLKRVGRPLPFVLCLFSATARIRGFLKEQNFVNLTPYYLLHVNTLYALQSLSTSSTIGVKLIAPQSGLTLNQVSAPSISNEVKQLTKLYFQRFFPRLVCYTSGHDQHEKEYEAKN